MRVCLLSAASLQRHGGGSSHEAPAARHESRGSEPQPAGPPAHARGGRRYLPGLRLVSPSSLFSSAHSAFLRQAAARATAPRISTAAPTPCPTAPTAATRPAGCDACVLLHLARLLRTLRLSNFEPPPSPLRWSQRGTASSLVWSRKTASFQPLACRGRKPGLTEAEAQREDEKQEERNGGGAAAAAAEGGDADDSGGDDDERSESLLQAGLVVWECVENVF